MSERIVECWNNRFAIGVGSRAVCVVHLSAFGFPNKEQNSVDALSESVQRALRATSYCAEIN